MFSREGDREILRCLTLEDGKEVWRESYAAPYEMSFAARKHGKGPKSTPTLAGGRIFALGIAGHLSAWDAASGRVLWRKDFSGQFKTTSPEFGTAASPLVEGDTVIVHVGGKDSGALAAFDAATGAIRWYLDFSRHPELANLFYDNGVERLANGNLYFGDRSTGRVLELDMLGRIVNDWPKIGRAHV